MPVAVGHGDQKISASATEVFDPVEPIRSLAHDLRTPLTSLQSCLDLVLSGQAGDLTGDQRRFLGMARRNIDRLDRMVQDMLTGSAPTAGAVCCRPRDVDLGPILREACRLHGMTALNQGVVLDDSGLPESFPARVDPDLVVRMLDNALGNALKFTGPQGQVRVRLEEGAPFPPGLLGRLARHCGLPAATFNLIVQDNGPGLEAAVSRRLFEPFNRGTSPARSRSRGTGLGLSIIRRLAESHGGQARLVSLPGRGTTVWLKLPRDPGAERLQRAVERLAEALVREVEHGIRPLVGILDLRPIGPQGGSPPDLRLVEGFFGRESRGPVSAWELAPGLWTAAVMDPVNWSRRWTLYAARVGGGLAAGRWEFLADQGRADSTVTGNSGKQSETMVNPASNGPNNR